MLETIVKFIKGASTTNYKDADYLLGEVQELINKGDVRIFVEQGTNNVITLKLFNNPNEKYGGGPVYTGDEMTLQGDEFLAQYLVSDFREAGYKAKFIYSRGYFFQKLSAFAQEHGYVSEELGWIEGPRGKYFIEPTDWTSKDELLFGFNGCYFSWESLKTFLDTPVEQVPNLGSSNAYKAKERGIVDINDYHESTTNK
ncbi:hypothetical protein ABEX78_22980 [Priestia megaterium]